MIMRCKCAASVLIVVVGLYLLLLTSVWPMLAVWPMSTIM